jgi:hypothetical protein
LQLASRAVGISAHRFDDLKTAVMTTILNVFRNAFIQAFAGTLSENKQDLPKVDPEKKKD